MSGRRSRTRVGRLCRPSHVVGDSGEGDAMEEGNDVVRADFREAFWRLYSHHGMDGLTAQALCEAAGYSRSSFYRHFQSVYDLLDEFEEAALPRAEMALLLDDIDTVGMAEFRAAFLSMFERKDELISVLCRFDQSRRYTDKFAEVIRPAFLAVIERTFDLDPVLAGSLADYIVVAKMALFASWARAEERFDIRDLLLVTDGVFEAGFWDLVDRSRVGVDGSRPPKVKPGEMMGRWSWLYRTAAATPGGQADRARGESDA